MQRKFFKQWGVESQHSLKDVSSSSPSSILITFSPIFFFKLSPKIQGAKSIKNKQIEIMLRAVSKLARNGSLRPLNLSASCSTNAVSDLVTCEVNDKTGEIKINFLFEHALKFP